MAKQVARIGNTIDIKTDVFSRFWPLNVLRVGVETARVVLVDIRDNDTVFDWHPSSGTELTIGGIVQDNEAADAIEVAATSIRDLVHSESGGGPETDAAALAAVDALAASRGQGVDAATLNTATGEKFRLETVGPRTITGPLTSIEVYNATNEPIDVQGVEVEANSGKTLTRPSATSNLWSDFMAAVLLLLTFAVSGVVAQEIPAEYLPAIQTAPVTQQSDVGILSAAQLQSYTTAERDALQLTANERRLIWNLDNQQIEQWDGATWGPIGGDSISGTFINEGVLVDAAPPWEGSFILRDNIEGNLSTGVNLTEVDDIVIYFSRDVNATGANLWPAPSATIRVDDILLDVPQGALITHFDNQFLAIANTSAAMLQAGDIRFRAESNNTTFGYEIYRIEFKKRAVGVSNRVGMREWGPSGRTPDEGYLAMSGVVVNGAVDYPIAAQRNPLFVSGNDFDFTKYEGAFVRNLGGNAAGEGVLQQDQQERSPNNPVGTQVNGGGGQTVRSVTANNETRPVNVAEQLYLIVDTYLEVNASSGGGLDLHPTCFAITPADPALTTPNVFDWNVNQVNDIRATAFYITQDSSSSTPLTELVVPLGETVEFMIVGPLYSSDTVFGNIGGVRLNATNTDGVLSFEHIEQRFTPAVATWPNTVYDDLNQSNATVGEFRQASADFLFTDIPVDLSQLASDVKSLLSSDIGASTETLSYATIRQDVTTVVVNNGAVFPYNSSNSIGSGWEVDEAAGTITATRDMEWATVRFDGIDTNNSSLQLRLALRVNNVIYSLFGLDNTAGGGEGDADAEYVGPITAGDEFSVTLTAQSVSANYSFYSLSATEHPAGIASPTVIPATGTNPAARLELTNNTLQSELSLVLGDLGISVDGVAVMPMTSADYTQGGITAVTADSTNWTRASTGNRPADTNVGFENVPQGRYRYTFSVPEQEDGSTVDANDVADNDRPFPIILVNGVPAKLHADNTYIEHDDGSTSEYHSSGTIVVPEGGSVQLGLVIEGGDTEEFEFQSAVITTEQGADAIYGFFEIEKIDRPVVAPAVNEVTQQLAALQNQFDINSTDLVTIPDLQFDVKAGEKWVFEVNLLANNLDAAADLRAGTIAPTGSTGRFTFVNAENAVIRGADVNDATLALVVATGTDDLIQIKGIVTAGEDGVVQFQLRNNTGTVLQSFRPDSWVEAKKIP